MGVITHITLINAAYIAWTAAYLAWALLRPWRPTLRSASSTRQKPQEAAAAAVDAGVTSTGSEAGMNLGAGAAAHPSVEPEAAAPSRWDDGDGGGWAHSEEEGSGPEGGEEEGGGGAPDRRRLPAAIAVFASGAPDHAAIRCEQKCDLGEDCSSCARCHTCNAKQGVGETTSTHYCPALMCMLCWSLHCHRRP